MGERLGLGMLLGVLAYSLFAMHDATNKWLVEHLPVPEVLFFRSLAIVVGVLVASRGRLVPALLASTMKLSLAGRGVLTLAAWLCYYTAAASLSLAQLTTLYYASPLLTTLLARPMLGERVTRLRWTCVGIGFAGVLVASDPFGVPLSLATGLVLAAAAMWALAVILMRQIARRESSLLQVFSQNLVFLVATGAASIWHFHMPHGLEWLLLLEIGAFGGCGQYLLFEAARQAPAAVMATVEYVSLIWAFVLGYLVFGDIPPVAVFGGAALIMLAGAVLVIGEQRKRATA
jgi:drug/metabolite transporter (DMT)-like permease